MHDPRPLARHVSGLLADLAAEHGEVEVVRRRWDCEPDEYEALVETFETFGVVGGATARVRDDEGRLLLVRGPDRAASRGGEADGTAGEARTGPAEPRSEGGDASGDRERAVEEATGVWTDPGDARRPGEGYRECARRATREAAGVDVQIEGLAAVHIHLADDWTDRPPVPDPALVFEARPRDSTEPTLGDGVLAADWFERLPDDLLYEELAGVDSAGNR